ncbi:MAG TPA: LysM peptidoglycan-binding domain-containing protein [Oculatellaceae cyanobacterium]
MTDTVGDERIAARVSTLAANIDADALLRKRVKSDPATSSTGTNSSAGDSLHGINSNLAKKGDLPSEDAQSASNDHAQISLLSVTGESKIPASLGAMPGADDPSLPVLRLFAGKLPDVKNGTPDVAVHPVGTTQSADGAQPVGNIQPVGTIQPAGTIQAGDATQSVGTPQPVGTIQPGGAVQSTDAIQRAKVNQPGGDVNPLPLASTTGASLPPIDNSSPIQPLTVVTDATSGTSSTTSATTIANANAGILAQLDKQLLTPSTTQSAILPARDAGLQGPTTVTTPATLSTVLAPSTVSKPVPELTQLPGTNSIGSQNANAAFFGKANDAGLGLNYSFNANQNTLDLAGIKAAGTVAIVQASSDNSSAVLPTAPIGQIATNPLPKTTEVAEIGKASLLAQLDQQVLQASPKPNVLSAVSPDASNSAVPTKATLLAQLDQGLNTATPADVSTLPKSVSTSQIATSQIAASPLQTVVPSAVSADAPALPGTVINSAVTSDRGSQVKELSGLGLTYTADNSLVSARSAGFSVPLPTASEVVPVNAKNNASALAQLDQQVQTNSTPLTGFSPALPKTSVESLPVVANATLPPVLTPEAAPVTKDSSGLGVIYSADNSLSSARSAGFALPAPPVHDAPATGAAPFTPPVVASVSALPSVQSTDTGLGVNPTNKSLNANATLLAQLDQQISGNTQPSGLPAAKDKTVVETLPVVATTSLPGTVSAPLDNVAVVKDNSGLGLTYTADNSLSAARSAGFAITPATTQDTPVTKAATFTPPVVASVSSLPSVTQSSDTSSDATHGAKSPNNAGLLAQLDQQIVSGNQATPQSSTKIVSAEPLPAVVNTVSPSTSFADTGSIAKLGQTYSADNFSQAVDAGGFKPMPAAVVVAQATDTASTTSSSNVQTNSYSGTLTKDASVASVSQTTSPAAVDRTPTTELLAKLDQSVQSASAPSSIVSKPDQTVAVASLDKSPVSSSSTTANTLSLASAMNTQPEFRPVGPGTPSPTEQSSSAANLAIGGLRQVLAKQSSGGIADGTISGLQATGLAASIDSLSTVSAVSAAQRQTANAPLATNIGVVGLSQIGDVKLIGSTAVVAPGGIIDSANALSDSGKGRIGAQPLAGSDEAISSRIGVPGLTIGANVGAIGAVGNAALAANLGNSAIVGNAGIVGNVGNAAIVGNIGAIGNAALVGNVLTTANPNPLAIGNAGITGKGPNDTGAVKTPDGTIVLPGSQEPGAKGLVISGPLDANGNVIPGRIPVGIVEISTDTKTPLTGVAGATTKIDFIEEGSTKKTGDSLIVNTVPNPLVGPILVGSIKGGKGSGIPQETDTQSPTAKGVPAAGAGASGTQSGQGGQANTGAGGAAAGTGDPGSTAGATGGAPVTTAGTDPEPGTTATGTVPGVGTTTGTGAGSGGANTADPDGNSSVRTDLQQLLDQFPNITIVDHRHTAENPVDSPAVRHEVADLDDGVVKTRNDSVNLNIDTPNNETGSQPTTKGSDRPEGLTEDDDLKNFIQEFEERRFYRVKKGDTLSKIAMEKLGSLRFIPLLIELNRDSIKVLPNGDLQLVAGADLILPNRADITRFISMGDDARAVYLESISEKSEDYQPKYVCRIGDNLTSIARRHPAMRDARLWPLLADVNNLSDRQNKEKMPVEKLRRGQVLIIPSAKQCLEFLQDLPNSTVPKPLRGSIFGNGAECWPPKSNGDTCFAGKQGNTKKSAGRPWIQEGKKRDGSEQFSDDQSQTKATGSLSGETRPTAGKPYIQEAGTSTSSQSQSADAQSGTVVTGALSVPSKSPVSKPYIQEAGAKSESSAELQSDTVVTGAMSENEGLQSDTVVTGALSQSDTVVTDALSGAPKSAAGRPYIQDAE